MNRPASRTARGTGAAGPWSPPGRATATIRPREPAPRPVATRRPPGGATHRRDGDGAHRVVRAATELERQALAWDRACARAGDLAAALRREVGDHPAVVGIRADRDRVWVLLRLVATVQWAPWGSYLGVPVGDGRHGGRPEPRPSAGEGRRDGVRVSVRVRWARPAYRGVPSADTTGAGRTYRLDGVVHDLTRPQRDAHGDVWYFQGVRGHDGMPLLSLDGRPERCSLANVVAFLGPLAPVREPAPRPGPVR
ncbi:BN159_2729 family protein [Streptomyces longwoodensis]|uniref:BN159_2729 family protein n=1 Tax=Streptomyces longwoodensis TaxID=68231 RepID=UPI0033FCD6CE